MKKILALALVGALALAGCAPKESRAGRSGDSGTQQQQPGGAPVINQPAPAKAPDLGSVNSDLDSVDSLMGGVDDDLSAAAKTSDDAD